MKTKEIKKKKAPIPEHVKKKNEEEGIKEEAPKRKSKTPSLLRGMRDILPEEDGYWRFVRDVAEKLAEGFNFGRIDTPILEEANLFLRAVGKETDIAEKEMYVFIDKEGEKIALRPEATASVARAYIRHGMHNLPQPVRFFYWGPMFRHDRPQAGRYRQFYQCGYEIIGGEDPVVDALIIFITYKFYSTLGIRVKVHVNSIGTPESRTRYKMELIQYYRSKRNLLCEYCKKRLSKNPIRLLDCNNEACRVLRDDAPQIVDWLSEECKQHFMGVLEYLDELQIPYYLDPHLVRGLDYYTRTVFEFYADTTEGEGESKGAQSALCGGGRYDLLIEQLGGNSTPACGVAPGIERAILQLKAQQVTLPQPPRAQIFIAQLGQRARLKAMVLFERLREGGYRVVESFAKNSLKAQLELADKYKAPFALILGQKEVLDGTVIIRDMDSGIQEVVNFEKIEGIMKRKLESLEQMQPRAIVSEEPQNEGADSEIDLAQAPE